jgi:hypothetical protein
MERRLKFFEQMRHRLENIEDETVDLISRTEEPEEVKVIEPAGNQEYAARLKTKLTAWATELNKWETEADKVVIDEECADNLARLDLKLAEGYEKMRELLCTTDDEWDTVREDAETLWQEIVSTFDEIRHCVGGK